MRKQPSFESNSKVVTILSISPLSEDHLSLQAIVGHSNWKLVSAYDLTTARQLLSRHEVSVVICERDLRPGTWIDLLESIGGQPHAPSIVVASRLADEQLWAEALNRGAWDVLGKPFDLGETVRSVKSAWQNWFDRFPGRVHHIMAAAS